MGELIRAKDWSGTPLGPVDAWPEALHSALSICLGSSSAIAIYWGSDLILLYNDTWRTFIGDKHPQALGRPASEIFPEIWQEIGSKFKHVLSTGEATGAKDQLLPLYRHGYREEECYFNYTFNPLLVEDGSVGGIFNIGIETTSSVLAKRKLRGNEARLKAILKSSELGVWDLKIKDGSAWRSPKHDQIFGYDSLLPEWNYEKFMEHVIPEDRAEVDRKFKAALAGNGMWDFECRIRRTDGARRWIWARGQVLHTDEDPPERMMGTVLDITERKQLEEKLKTINETLEERVEERTATLLSYQDKLRLLALQLNKAEEQVRERLAAELHDNLGQMLVLCKMKIYELLEDSLSDQTASVIAELTELVNEALRYTRELMTDLKLPPVIDKEDLGKTMDWLIKTMKKYGLKVTVEDDKQPKPLREEVRTILQQSIRELLFNVVKHAQVSEARVVLSRQDKQIQVTVEDEGKGFDVEEKELYPTEYGGFGLFNLRERMDLLGGSIEIISEPGEGTRITLFAPVKKESDIPAQSDEEKQKRTRPLRLPVKIESDQKIRVLLVDDHHMVRRGLRKLIEEQDDLTVIMEASNGKDAVQLARETSPDVMVMDVNMPGMNGIEATQKIRAEMPKIRIIGLSLHNQEDVARNMRSAGASAFVTKAEAFETLCATIRREALVAKNN